MQFSVHERTGFHIARKKTVQLDLLDNIVHLLLMPNGIYNVNKILVYISLLRNQPISVPVSAEGDIRQFHDSTSFLHTHF